ncbi:MAG: tyrosine-type recombinase/integrase, partial [Flammeovirgaceae bacterium]
MKKLESKDADSFLFPNPTDKTKHITRKALNQVCDRLKKKNPEFSNLHPHALRHTCATQLINSGAKLHEVREVLGHKKYDTTLIYTHIPTEILKQRVDAATTVQLSLTDKIKNFFFPPQKATLINLTNDNSKFIIGRNAELLKLTELATKNCNTILMGGIGSGKTHL